MQERLHKKLKLLKEPRSYYSGLALDYVPQLPDEILMVFKGPIKMTAANVHHRFLLIANFKNPINLILDSKRFILNKDHAMLVLPHQHHLFVYDNEDVERLLITFEGCDIEEMRKFKDKVFSLNDAFMETLEMLACEYLSDTKRNNFSGGRRCSLLLGLLLTDLERCSRKYVVKTIPGENCNAEKIDRINMYIQAHLDTPLSIKQIAGDFGYSCSHLRLLYRKSMGVSIGKYIREIKINKACGYLGDSRISIGDIARICGYSSLYAFSHSFRKDTGISPIAYRKKLAAQQ